METVEEKAAQGKAADQDEKAFEMVGPNAPQEVKDAWMEAAKEVNANGMGIRGNGMMSHISQMMVQIPYRPSPPLPTPQFPQSAGKPGMPALPCQAVAYWRYATDGIYFLFIKSQYACILY